MRKLDTDHALIIAGILVMLVVLAGLFLVTSTPAAESDRRATATNIAGASNSPDNKNLTHDRSLNSNRGL